MDKEVSYGRKIALKRLFPDQGTLDIIEEAFVEFCTGTDRFGCYDIIRDRGSKKPHTFWALHGSTCPPLQQLTLRLLSQVISSSCYERNWNIYSKVHSVEHSKLDQKRAAYSVYVHTNLRLLYRQR